jgi:hypothetical protein
MRLLTLPSLGVSAPERHVTLITAREARVLCFQSTSGADGETSMDDRIITPFMKETKAQFDRVLTAPTEMEKFCEDFEKRIAKLEQAQEK